MVAQRPNDPYAGLMTNEEANTVLSSWIDAAAHTFVYASTATIGAFSIFALVGTIACWAENKEGQEKNQERMTSSILLADYEHTYYSQFWPTYANLTFLASDNIQDTAEFLKERIKKVLKKNPWLAGRLIICDKTGKKKLIYDEKLDVDKFIDEHFCVAEEHENTINLSTELTHDGYMSMVHAVDPFMIEKANAVVGQFDQLLCRFVLIPMGESGKESEEKEDGEANCALATIMSHQIGDGYTFYGVYSMLNPNNPIISLPIKRLDNFDEMAKKLMGETAIEDFWPSGYKNLVGAFFNRCAIKLSFWNWRWWVFSTHPKISCFHVDKSTEQATNEHKKHYAEEGGVEFVSTNDILCSAFFHAADSNYCGTTINLRLFSGDKKHMALAGNYSVPLMYRREDYATPALIRKSLQNDPSSGKPMIFRASEPTTPAPNASDFWGGHSSFFTNITGPDPDLKIPNAKHVMWVPVPDPVDISGYRDFGIVFKPYEGCLSTLCFFRDSSSEETFYENVSGIISDCSNPDLKKKSQ